MVYGLPHGLLHLVGPRYIGCYRHGLAALTLNFLDGLPQLLFVSAQGRDFLFMAPHIATIPSCAIFVIVLAANLLGDALRDVLDPRLQT